MRIAIIGAGVGGMAAAYDLLKAGHDVTIYEAADYVGGLAAGFKEPGWDWSVERFYHHWFQTDHDMMGLIDELGWKDQVVTRRPFTVMYHNGKFYPFDSYLYALLYPGLGLGLNKIRFGLVGVYLRLTSNWRSFEKYTTDAWMRKWAGDKVYEAMWEPMLIGQVRRTLRQSGQHGLDVGPFSRPHYPTEHLPGWFSGFCRSLCRPPARDGGAHPPGVSGAVD